MVRLGARICLILAMAILWAGSAAAHELEIVIKDRAKVSGTHTYLKDIASFYPQDHPMVGTIGQVKVCASPSPGETRTLTHSYLINKLQAALPAEARIKVRIPEAMALTRSARIMSRPRLKRIFIDYVRAHSPWKFNEMTIEEVSTPKLVHLPEGKLTWSVKKRGRSQWSGLVSLVITFKVDGRAIKKVPLSGRIKVLQRVVKASRNLPKGHILSEADLVESTEMTHYPAQEIPVGSEAILGMMLTRPIRGGQIITKAMVKSPPLVRKGERVLITAENRAIKVTTLGKVLEDGALGEQVRVVNITSGKQLFATVAGKGRVAVSF